MPLFSLSLLVLTIAASLHAGVAYALITYRTVVCVQQHCCSPVHACCIRERNPNYELIPKRELCRIRAQSFHFNSFLLLFL